MSRMKELILWRIERQREIDSQNDPDMEGPYDWEADDEIPAIPEKPKSDSCGMDRVKSD